jgi:transcriptional regulator with XRE-family HTH domain
MDATHRQLAHRVKSLREEKGLSQEALARKIGIPRSALSQIETGERRVTTDELVRLSEALSTPPGVLLGTETEPEVCLARDAKPAAAELPMRINVPQKNLAKFREVLLYVLGKVGSLPNVGETVIYKLLYFIDFDHYEKYEEQLIGATYIRNKFGPTPVEFGKVVERMERSGELERVRSTFYKYPQTKYLPRRAPNLTVLSAQEQTLIDDVLARFSGMTAAQLSAYSHGDFPWRAATEGKAIEYETVFYRIAPYSQREYPDTD